MIISNQGIDALIEFSEKTGAIIVTMGRNDQDLADLEKLLLAWQEKPTKANEKAIVDRFAIDEDDLADY